MSLFSARADVDFSPLAAPEPTPSWQPTPIPDVSKLENTSKDWVLRNGIYCPPQISQVTWHSNFIIGNALTIGPGSLPVPVGPYTTFSNVFVNPYTNWTPPEPPKPLPVEKREMPVIGYRAWRFTSVWKLGWGKHAMLSAMNDGFGDWIKGNNQASCIFNPFNVSLSGPNPHAAPNQHCACGFYVLADLDQVMSHVTMADNIVIGAVMGWGKVVQHGTEGWRTENAKIIALLDCKYSKEQSENTKAAAKSYDLEVKERPQLEALVSEWGDPFEK